MAKQLQRIREQLPIYERNKGALDLLKNKKKKNNKNHLPDHIICTLFSMCVTTSISPLFSKVHLRWDLNRIRREYFSSFTFCYV